MTWCEICHGATGTTCTCLTEAPFDVATGEAPAATPGPVAWQSRDRLAVTDGWTTWRHLWDNPSKPRKANPSLREYRPLYAEPTPNSETESALLEALEKIIAEVSERRVGHREKITEIARTAIDQARGDQ